MKGAFGAGDFLEQLRGYFQEAPFNHFMGFEVLPLADGYARVEAPFRPEYIGDRFRPALHGGVLTTLIDTTGGLAVWTRADAEARLSTIDLRVDFLRPAGADRVIAEARVVRVGNRVGVAEIKTFHPGSPSDYLATGIGVYNIARPREG